MNKLTAEQINFLLPSAYNAAVRAGYEILKLYKKECDYDISLKGDKTPITLADRKSHNLIKEYLGKTRIPILSEEGREMLYDERRGWDLFWMVDPLDGTKEFIKGNGEFTVNIALMVDNHPALAVVYVPYINKLYYAVRGDGSYLKTGVKPAPDADYSIEEIKSSGTMLPLTQDLNQPLRIGVSRSHNTEETFRYIDLLKLRFPDAEVIQQGSSYKFCLIAEGTFDFYIRTTNTYEWDTAAGELILEMSGGKTLSFPDQEPLEYNKMSLLNPNFICRSKHMPKMKL